MKVAFLLQVTNETLERVELDMTEEHFDNLSGHLNHQISQGSAFVYFDGKIIPMARIVLAEKVEA